MNQKELTKTFMMISNLKKPFGLHGLYENNSALKGLKSRWLLWPGVGLMLAQTVAINP